MWCFTWRRWWGFHQYLHLDVKGAVYEQPKAIGGDLFFLGRGGPAGHDGRLRPEAQDIHGRVVPALLRALQDERDPDLVTGCLVALAKIGDRSVRGGHSSTAALLRKYLPNSNQEIAETAAVSLGILGVPGAAPLLRDLLLDAEAGRRAMRRESACRTRKYSRP